MAQKRTLIALLKTKLSTLVLQKDELHGMVDSYLDNLTASTMSAIEGDGQQLDKLKEMNSVLDTVTESLILLIGWVEDHMSGSAARSPGFHQLKPAPLLSLSGLLSDKLVQEVSDADVTKLCQRVGLLEMAVTTCHSEVNKCFEQQTDTKSALESRLCSLREPLEHHLAESVKSLQQFKSWFEEAERNLQRLHGCHILHDEKLKEVENQIQEVDRKSSNAVKQQEIKLHEVEDLINQKEGIFTSRLEEMNGRVMLTVHKKLNQQEERYTYTDKQYAMRFDQTEKQLRKMACKNDIGTKNALAIDSVEKRLNKLEDKDECCHDVSRLENLIKDVESLKKSQDSKEELSSKLHKLEKQVEALTNQGIPMQEKLEEVEHLKKTFGQLTSSIASDRKELALVKSRLDTCTVHKQAPIGFTASYSPGAEDVKVMFSNVLCNEGNSYNCSTGLFTAPRDGLYAPALTLSLEGKGSISALLIHRKAESRAGMAVGYVSVSGGNVQSCGVDVVNMKIGETLEVHVGKAYEGAKLSGFSRFTCFSVG